MACLELKDYLDRNRVRYVTLIHSPAFTSQEVAASAHIKGRDFAKTVIVKLDGKMAMAVLPASFMVNFTLLKHAAGAVHAELATEQEFKTRFPECEPGAMPPFGNLYTMPVYLESSFAEGDEIAFNAGTHTEIIRMTYPDYVGLVHPEIVEISTEHWSPTSGR